MQILPVDLTSLVSVILGISIVLVPVIGLTARFALKPIVEAMGRSFQHKGLEETVQIMDRRMALMEQQIESMDSTVRRLADVAEFHRSLESGGSGEGPGPGS
jgi:uncharacterized protein (DUF2164 family)